MRRHLRSGHSQVVIRSAGWLAACAEAIALVVQSSTSSAQERGLGASANLVGLPVFTADNREIGKVTDVVREPQEPMLLAEIERPGAIGQHVVAIPIDVFVQRADRIELSLTFEQVRDRLAGPEDEP
jgi:hypothetical protein